MRCPRCRRDTPLTWSATQAIFDCSHAIRIGDGVIRYTPSDELDKKTEVHVRDNEASSYLRHWKFPTQSFRVKQFLAGLPPQAVAKPVLELGYGPGPYTRMLLEPSYDVIAVDFLAQSLLINRQATLGAAAHVCYVQADLHDLAMTQESTSLLLMCDSLQHLGDQDARNRFLTKAFSWLAPGGFFCIEFLQFQYQELHGGRPPRILCRGRHSLRTTAAQRDCRIPTADTEHGIRRFRSISSTALFLIESRQRCLERDTSLA